MSNRPVIAAIMLSLALPLAAQTTVGLSPRAGTEGRAAWNRQALAMDLWWFQSNDARTKNRLEQTTSIMTESRVYLEEALPLNLASLPVDTRSTLGDLMRQDTDLLHRIQSLAKDLTPLWYRPTADRKGTQVHWQVPLFPLLSTILEEEGFRAWGQPLPRLVDWRPTPTISGIVILAQEAQPWFGMDQLVDYEPVLYPQLLDQDGRVIASLAHMAPEFARAWGFVAHGTEEDLRLTDDPRTGPNPYVVKARAYFGVIPGSLVISGGDWDVILRSDQGRRAIQEGRIRVISRP